MEKGGGTERKGKRKMERDTHTSKQPLRGLSGLMDTDMPAPLAEFLKSQLHGDFL